MTRRRVHREAPELSAACIRMMRALTRRAGDGELEALEQLSFLVDSARLQLHQAANSYRDHWGYSWAEIGNALGISRQAAQQRFGRGFRP